MRVLVLGVRGMPNVQGGVETHAEQLYQRLAALGCEIEVLVRSPFVSKEQRTLGAIRLTRVWSPRSPGLEALVHSLLGVFVAAVRRPDILHIHAIGPAIVTPIARLLGLKVVVTHHGPDYDRDKWGRFARWVLRVGERLGMRFANRRIAISRVISALVAEKYGVESEVIPNGVAIPVRSGASDYVRRLGLEPGKYFLQVSRLVPEKRQMDLIRAFRLLDAGDWKLVLVGGFDGSAYCQGLRQTAAEAGVTMTGFLSGEPLCQIYENAGAFVLPSIHEGLPIALLEALSYGLRVIASDIPANLEVGLNDGSYFPVGDVTALAARIRRTLQTPAEAGYADKAREYVRLRYDWGVVAQKTMEVYRSAFLR